jgi:ABC-type phosphate/phosphonate transport system substrate-binding protein/rhodanese-related sulfurtransferase
MARFRFVAALAWLGLWAVGAQAAIFLSVTREVTEDTRPADIILQSTPLANYLSAAVGADIKISYSQNLTEELQHTRTGKFGILFGPAHVIGSALRYGYEPVAGSPGSEKMVFVVPAGSAIKSLEDLKDKRIGLPSADSLATYLALGEFNAKGIHAKSYFKEIRYFRLHEVALYSLELGTIDAAVADIQVARKWLAQNDGKVIYETKSVPTLGFAVHNGLDKAVQQKIRDALLSPNKKLPAYAQVASLGIAELKPIVKDDYSYVSTLGYFTPTLIAGIKGVNAEEARELMAKGVPFYDVRDEREYKEMHVKGAISVPYKEKSSKEIGFDMSKDEFKIAEAAKDKNAPLIFACNGGECWKSYKASVWAQQQGYRTIYWLRGGFPEWKGKGLPVEAS